MDGCHSSAVDKVTLAGVLAQASTGVKFYHWSNGFIIEAVQIDRLWTFLDFCADVSTTVYFVVDFFIVFDYL